MRDGFVMETGADSFLTEKPWAAHSARRLGLEAELIPTRAISAKPTWCERGRLVEIPAGFSLLAPMHLGRFFEARSSRRGASCGSRWSR